MHLTEMENKHALAVQLPVFGLVGTGRSLYYTHPYMRSLPQVKEMIERNGIYNPFTKSMPPHKN